jgi:hypothetical protein
MTRHTRFPRRRFLIGTGVVLAQSALAGNLARAQPAGQQAIARVPSKVGVAPGYIISGRGEHSSNPYFQPQGKPSNKRMVTPRAMHGKGIMEEDTP